MNLVENAIKYGKPLTPVVELVGADAVASSQEILIEARRARRSGAAQRHRSRAGDSSGRPQTCGRMVSGWSGRTQPGSGLGLAWRRRRRRCMAATSGLVMRILEANRDPAIPALSGLGDGLRSTHDVPQKGA